MQDIYFSITKNCNLECDHCFAECGPRKPTISVEDMKEVIDHFSWKIKKIIITGGEVFTRKKLLYSTLEYIQQQKFRKLKKIELQTNGFWATSERKINRTLDELVELGVTEFDVASNDLFHRQAGLNMKFPKLLGKLLLKRKMGGLRYFLPGKFHFITGRGLNLNPKKRAYYDRARWSHNCKKIKTDLTINYDGKVYPCGWSIPGTEIGNAKEERLFKIINKILKNENFLMLKSKDGPKRLARKIDLDKETIEEYSEYGPCTLCSYMFNNGLIKL